VRALFVLLLVSSSARAWEVGTPADVQQRIQDLQKAWEGKTPEQIAQDKLALAKQPRKPTWVEKRAWKVELGPLSYYFAVGRAPASGDATPLGVGNAAAGQGAPPGSARVLDWYYDEPSGTLYTLAVDAR
jgi:hypothetical protein